MSRQGRKRAGRERRLDRLSRTTQPPAPDRRPTFSDDERTAAEAAFDDLLNRRPVVDATNYLNDKRENES